MSRVPPKMRRLARQLMASEKRAHRSYATTSLAALPESDRLRPHLSNLMGDAGSRALLSRALVLAQEQVPRLSGLHVNSDGSWAGLEALQLQLGPEAILKGKEEILAQLLGLLVAFIGPNLTWHLLGDVWPQLWLSARNFETRDEI